MNKLPEPIFIIRGLRREAVVGGSDTLSSSGGRVVILPCCGGYSIIKLNQSVIEQNSSPENH